MNDERHGLPSASGATIFYNCPASDSLQKQAPKTESDDPLAIEGTLIHEALETDDGSELNLSQQEIAANIAEVADQLYRSWREEFPINDKGVEIREERYWLWDDQGNTGSAKPDIVYIVGDHALVIDAKSGFKQVEDASRNLQGRIQAVAVWMNNPEVIHVRSAFAQYRFKKHYTYCDYEKNDLSMALHEWNMSVWRSKRPDAPAIPGTWCVNCRAKGFCVSAGAYALLPSSRIGGKVGLEKSDVLMLVQQLSQEDLVAIHERSTIITNVLDAVKVRLKSIPDERLKELGYELKEGSEYITKVDVQGFFVQLWEAGVWDHIPDKQQRENASKEDFKRFSTLLVGEAKKHFAEMLVGNKKFKTKKAAEESLNELLAQVSQKERKDKSLKRIKG